MINHLILIVLWGNTYPRRLKCFCLNLKVWIDVYLIAPNFWMSIFHSTKYRIEYCSITGQYYLYSICISTVHSLCNFSTVSAQWMHSKCTASVQSIRSKYSSGWREMTWRGVLDFAKIIQITKKQISWWVF